ncbi:MAG: TetR family transcriptional regulator [Rhodospirillales bacterium]|nr:TetR family transcriptional regulator [Acetobacter sp.]
MPRWEHGSEDRLKKAARELFDEQGFEQTSVAEIARCARVTTRTFFRYFSDKSEVLFAGSDALRDALIEKILQVPAGPGPLQVVTGALAAFNWESLEPRRSQRARHAVIAANPGLLERDLSKLHRITVGIAEALRQRGVDAETAQLAARVGIQVFSTAYQRWLEARDKVDLATITDRAMSLLSTMVPAGAPSLASRRKKPYAAAKQAKSTALRKVVASRFKGGPRR